MPNVYKVSYRVGGGRRKHIVVAADDDNAARRHVFELEDIDVDDNNLFLNMDGIDVTKVT
ncbi:hypothetical protein SAMN05720470_1019 [Fibrobacter sp. UWOV1]|uniref:hypothetical protein n=1 Tax=Fibrobacter sp. UWOV1 TaxID=1896215 RepID=UPI000913D050|nr:hypothetical protein [Fibrobacter sp. UWOV1]SHK27233.1 hypothetical protein SAMN05720470_1019 [Fibrobacter sp. UWOV1]